MNELTNSGVFFWLLIGDSCECIYILVDLRLKSISKDFIIDT